VGPRLPDAARSDAAGRAHRAARPHGEGGRAGGGQPAAGGVTMARYVELAAEPTVLQRVRAWPLRRTVATVYGTGVAALVITVYLCSVFGWLPRDPDAMDLDTMNALPSAAHWMGTDFVGRDLLSRIMVGTQAFFLPGLLSVSVSLVFGALFGVLAGFWPERFATPVSLLLQLLESLPKLVLILLVI